MNIKKIFFLTIGLMLSSVISTVCFAAQATVEQAEYFDDTSDMVLRITGLDEVAGREASLAMFDTKNPAIPVYFAQPKIAADGDLDYTFVFHMPEGRSCDEYSISINAYNVIKLTTTPKSIYDKKCKVYFENLQYSVGEGKKM